MMSVFLSKYFLPRRYLGSGRERIISGRIVVGGNSASSSNAISVHLGDAVDALDLLVQQASHVPSSLFQSVLKSCLAQKDLVLGRRIHSLVFECGYGSSTFLVNHIIRLYVSCGKLDEATKVFTNLASPDTFSWCSVIKAHTGHGQPEQAIKFYRRMRNTTVKANNYVFVEVLKACASAKDLVSGKEVHVDIGLSTEVPDMFVGNCLVDMYAKCGAVEDARRVFDNLPTTNVVTWNAMLTGYARHGLGHEAITLYARMQQENAVLPDHFTFSCLLRACASTKSLHDGKKIHSHILESGLEGDVVVGNSLVDMYAKCGSLEDARNAFENIPTKTVVTWNSMLTAYVQHGMGQEALLLHADMQHEGMTSANHVTFVCLLQACAAAGALHYGKLLNAQIIAKGLEADVKVGNCLVDMYAKCGSLVDARRVFDRLPTRDVVTWNAMLAGYVQHGLNQDALDLYHRLHQEGTSLVADHFTYACLLKACASSVDLFMGRKLHQQICERGIEADTVIGNCLVYMYAKCASLEDAHSVFEGMASKNLVSWNAMITGYVKCGRLDNARAMFDDVHIKDVLTWNAMIAGYVQHGLGQEALALYASMREENNTEPDNFTFSCLLKACASIGALHDGEDIHSQILQRKLEGDVVVGHCLVDMYAKCGSLEDARRAFDNLPTKNVVTWNAMLTGYAQHGLGQDALSLYASMQQVDFVLADHVTFVCLLQTCSRTGDLNRGTQLHTQIREAGLETDVVIGNCLVDMYARCGDLEHARTVFDNLPAKNMVSWNAMMTGYIENGLSQEALNLYGSMESDSMNSGNQGTFVCLLKACTNVGALDQGKQLHSIIQEKGLERDMIIGNCLVDMYTKCGSLESARRVFDRLPTRDVITWTTLLNGYAHNSDSRMAIQCFNEMRQQGVEPDGATFTSLLVACSQEGLLYEGQQYFKMMKDIGIVPSAHHHNCMVDLLGRAGYLDAAENMLQTMPIMKDVVGWKSLLTACKSHGDVERAKRCFDQLVKLEPENAASYVLLASSYASAGRWREADTIEGLRKSAGAWKKPAMASIEVHSKTHTFTVGEERSDLSSKLRSVTLRLKEGGHFPHTELVLNGVCHKDREEDGLCGHAEKLALAYGLLNTPDGTPLLVTKNLRMCNDCHSGTKIMSKLERREIIVRDANRVHHFLDGFCSCGDRH